MKLQREVPLSRMGHREVTTSFRKACYSRIISYASPFQRSRRSSRTCFEAPFGEVIRSSGPMAKSNPFRFSTKFQDDETDLLYYGHRYLSVLAGRWWSRDPAWEIGGKNLYAMISNDPVGSIDVLGLWKTHEHRTLTERAVSVAYAALKTTSKCHDRVLGAIWEANEAQDGYEPGGSLWDNRRHYNRDVSQTGAEGEAGYHTYLREETMRFVGGTIEHTTPTCRRALWSLGRIMHSWQDFYMHAIRRDGQGGRENSNFPGWTAWSVGIIGNPDVNHALYPSSFDIRGGGEHPVGAEPVLPSSPEFSARYGAALTYTSPKVAHLLRVWMRECRCSCEQSSDISWYTTELPGR
jgi:RHS repeat-associated protein